MRRAVFVAALAALLLAPYTEQRLLRRSSDVGSGDSPMTSPPRLPVDDDDFSGDFRVNNGRNLDIDDNKEGSGAAPVTMTTKIAVAVTSIPSTTSQRGRSTIGTIRSSTSGRQDRPGSESYIDIDAPSATKQPQQRPTSSSKAPLVHHHSLSTARLPQASPGLNNAVPSLNVPTNLPTIDEAKEEASNSIAGAGFAVAQSRMGFRPDQQGLHPGLLAAVIGGGVVGLLCAILLVMFVVYRLRKKDEGGYTTVDAKPRLNTYTKASSREFYA